MKIIEIEYNMTCSDDSLVRASLDREEVFNCLMDWFERERATLGRVNEDSDEPAQRTTYKIRICHDEETDKFTYESDTGNLSLTTGIVFDVAHRLSRLNILPIEG